MESWRVEDTCCGRVGEAKKAAARDVEAEEKVSEIE